MTKENIIDNIARLNSETWRDREEVRTEIGKLLGELKKALEQPVSPTRKVGKWIFHEKSISTAFKELRECSCCHCYFRWEMPRNSYCPNCGAEMRGSEND